MEKIGSMIRRLRKEKGEPIRVLAAYLQVDQAVMSKMERGLRKPTKEQVEKLAVHFGADKKEMLIAWLSDRIVYEIRGESFAEEALKVAEEKMMYRIPKSLNRKSVIQEISSFFKHDGRISKAWVFGSFARGNDQPTSDIDLMVEEDKNVNFSYFDLADIQFQLEQLIHRKVDIGFAKVLKENAAPQIHKEAVLIYEKP
jgi:predicted nucleotidyltransferase